MNQITKFCLLSGVFILSFSKLMYGNPLPVDESTNGIGSVASSYVQSRMDIISHSPEAESLGKYGVMPVTLYTGLPEISIPLFELKTPSLTIPFSLQYNYNGCKPNEMASYVGLGWNLSGGGVINRIIKGRFDDLVSYPFDTYGSFDPLYLDQQTLTNIAINTLDSQPDEYVFNIGRYSGKFIIIRGKAYVCTCPNITVTPIYSSNYLVAFQIIDETGNSYQFNFADETTGGNELASSLGIPSYRSAWYVGSIISANKQDTVSFNYQPYTYNQPTTIYDEYTLSSNGSSSTQTENIYTDSNSGNTVSALLLASVTSKYGSIVFSLDSTRKDLKGSTNAQMLNRITHYSAGSQYSQKIKLNYSYFSGNARLRLDSISFGNIDKKYSFSYTDGTFPTTTSKAIDLYGYANGETGNLYLFPTGVFMQYSNYTPGKRESNINYGQLGILNQITYPTGGYSVFQWEQNMINQTTSGPGLRIKQIAAYGNQNSTTSLFVDQYSYSGANVAMTDAISSLGLGTMTTSGESTSTCYFASVRSALSDYDSEQFYYPQVTKTSQNAQSTGKTVYTYEASPTRENIRLQSQNDYQYLNGQYVPVKSQSFQYQFPLKNQWECFLVNEQTTVNGSGMNGVGVTELNSPDENEAACLTAIYGINKEYAIAVEYALLTQDSTTLYDNNGNITVKSHTDYYYDNPDHTLPTRVITQNSAGEQIITEYKYPLDYNWGSLIMPDSINEHYNTEIQTAVNVFFNSYNSLNAALQPYQQYCSSSNQTAFINLVKQYPYVANFATATNMATSYRDAALANYFSSLSTGIANSTIPWQQAVLWMQLNHIVTPVIEKYVSVINTNGQEILLNATRNQFALMNNNTAVMPSAVQQTEISSDLLKSAFLTTPDSYYKTQYSYTYDPHLQLSSQTGQDNVPYNYIWGYNELYPVAQVIGSNYATIAGLANTTVLNNATGSYSDQQIRTELQKIHTGLSGVAAMPTTYSYQPLAGMSSETNPQNVATNYMYDSFNRLWVTRNDDDNILARYQYSYQNEPENGMGGYAALIASLNTSASYYLLNGTGSASITTNGGSGSFSYSWSLQNSSGTILESSTATSFSFTCSQSGTLTLQCIVTDNTTGQTTAVTQTVPCYTTPTTSVSVGASAYVLNGTGSATATASGGSGNFSYSWSLMNSAGTVLQSSTSNSFSFTCSQVGTLTVQCIVKDNVTGQTATSVQTVPCYNVLTATLAIGSKSYILHNTGIGTASVTGGSGVYTYSWYLLTSSGTVLQSSLNSTSNTFSFVYSQTGMLTLKCIITDKQAGQTTTASFYCSVVN